MKQLYNAKMRSDGRSEVVLIAETMVIQMTYQYDPHAGDDMHVFSRDEITVSGRTKEQGIRKMQIKLNK